MPAEDPGLDLDRILEEFRRRWRVRLRRAAREALGEGAGQQAFSLLELVAQHGPLSPTELAQRLELRTSTITAHVDRLEESGWVTRDGQGRRGVRVMATPAGEAAHRRFLGLRRQLLGDLVAELPADDVQGLASVLAVLVRRMQEDAR
jgi:DNA-binding MarR family transcriptional regulator